MMASHGDSLQDIRLNAELCPSYLYLVFRRILLVSSVNKRRRLRFGRGALHSVRDFSRTKGFIRIFEGFCLKTKGFLPKVYEIFGSEMPLGFGKMQNGLSC